MGEQRWDIRRAARWQQRVYEIPIAWRRMFLLALMVFGGFVTYLFLREPLGELPARTVGIFIFAACCWATEVVPLYATSFLVICGEVVLLASSGGLADSVTDFVHWVGLPEVAVSAAGEVGPIASTAFLEPFARDIMFLFMGGFLLSAAVTRHGLDRVIARVMLGPFQGSAFWLMVAVLVSAAVLSMWISNTATAAMLIAVVKPLLRAMPEREPYRVGLALAVPVGANVGGIGTPIGSPPNAIAYGALNAAGFEVTFLGWTLLAIPLLVLLLFAACVVLWVLHRPSEGFEMPGDMLGGDGSPIRLGAMGAVTLVVMGLAIVGWLTSDLTGLRPGMVALCAAALLTATRALDRSDVDSIDWDVLILMWGGLSLSVAMEASGLTSMMASLDLSVLPGGSLLLGSLVAVSAVALSTFMSNTATAGLMVPMALALSIADRAELAIVVALSCSFAMVMPVSTPPNAIAFASGAIPLVKMVRAGFLIGGVCVVLTLCAYWLVLPLLFSGG